MMRKAQAAGITLIVVFVIIFLLAFIIYSKIGSFGEETSSQAGSEALELSFYTLPEEITSGQKFDIEILAKNKGDYTIPKEQIRVILNSPEPPESQPLIQKNAEELSNRGGETEFVYSGISYYPVGDVPQVPVSAGICYPYKTSASITEVCLVRNANDDSVCKAIEEKQIATHEDGPVHITKFTQRSSVYNSGEKYIDLNVRMDFAKVGAGNIYHSAATCGDILPYEINKVRLKLTIGGKEIGDKEVKSIKGVELDKACNLEANAVDLDKGYIICTLRWKMQEGQSDATDVLGVEMNYLVDQQLTQVIKVNPTG